MKVAIVCDRLSEFNETERAFLELANLFPEAPIYTFLYNETVMSDWFPRQRVQMSFLQKFPKWLTRGRRFFSLLAPIAAETIDFRDFDLVISAGVFSKGVVTRPKTTHVHYSHDFAAWWQQPSAKISLNFLRLWDRSAAQRVDYFIADSRDLAARIKKYYRRQSSVIYPPVLLSDVGWRMSDTGYQIKKESDESWPQNYFLIVSSLTFDKKTEIAVEAFNKLGLPLVIIGDGPRKKYLSKIAKSNISFFDEMPIVEKNEYYKNCVALISISDEHFKVAAIEAMGFGRPVLAFKTEGASEIVLPGVTGEFFEAQTPEVLADGVRRLRENLPNFKPLVIRQWAERFSVERFRREFMEFLDRIGYNKGKNNDL